MSIMDNESTWCVCARVRVCLHVCRLPVEHIAVMKPEGRIIQCIMASEDVCVYQRERERIWEGEGK